MKRILALHPNKLIDLSLDRVERLLEDLGRPQDRVPPVIHVAGTNGKGSTIAFLRAILEAADQRVHVYTSPHLVRFNERIRLGGELVSSKTLNAALERCEEVNAGQPITYFELTTVAAILLFSEIEADYLLLEVGLGGRFDATNVIDHPLASVITPVSMDHEDFLGSDVGTIALEKAGILKEGSPAIIGQQTDAGGQSIDAEAAKLGIVPFRAGQEFDGFEQRGRLIYQDDIGLLDLPPPALIGPFQFSNAALAIAVIRHLRLPVNQDQIAAGLRSVRWPARMMALTEGKLRDLLPASHELWLDGGHNEAGGQALAQALRVQNTRASRPLVLVFGTFANKDPKAYLGHFLDQNPTIFTVRMGGDRGSWSAKLLAEQAKAIGLEASPKRSVKSALAEAAEIKNARVVICGSLHLAGATLAKNGTKLA